MGGPTVIPHDQTLGMYGPVHSSDVIWAGTYPQIAYGDLNLSDAYANQIAAVDWIRISFNGGAYNDASVALPTQVKLDLGYNTNNGFVSYFGIAVFDLPAAAPAAPLGLLYDSGTITFGKNILPTPLDPAVVNSNVMLEVSDLLATGAFVIEGYMTVHMGISLIKV